MRCVVVVAAAADVAVALEDLAASAGWLAGCGPAAHSMGGRDDDGGGGDDDTEYVETHHQCTASSSSSKRNGLLRSVIK